MLDEFESTTSSFITNIDSFCRSQVEQGAQLEASTAGPSRLTSPQVLDEFESTTSSFMLNVDSFCGVNTPKDVGNDQNLESPKNQPILVENGLKKPEFLRLSSVMLEGSTRPHRNEHVVCCVAEWIETKPTKGYNVKVHQAREIGLFATSASMNSDCFGEFFDHSDCNIGSLLPGCLCSIYESCVMCCVVVEPSSSPRLSLWDHLKAISKQKFSVGSKRKQIDPEPAQPSRSLACPTSTQCSLVDSLKKMKLEDEEIGLEEALSQAAPSTVPVCLEVVENGEPVPSREPRWLDSLLQEDKFSRRF